jgi:hypothetical protein
MILPTVPFCTNSAQFAARPMMIQKPEQGKRFGHLSRGSDTLNNAALTLIALATIINDARNHDANGCRD